MDLSFPHGKSVNDGIDAQIWLLFPVSKQKKQLPELLKWYRDHRWRSSTSKKHIGQSQSTQTISISSVLSGTISCISMQLSPLGFAVPHSYSQLWLMHYNGQFNSEEYLIQHIPLRTIIVGPPNSDQYALYQQIIMATCKELGVPLAAHKSVGPIRPGRSFIGRLIFQIHVILHIHVKFIPSSVSQSSKHYIVKHFCSFQASTKLSRKKHLDMPKQYIELDSQLCNALYVPSFALQLHAQQTHTQ